MEAENERGLKIAQCHIGSEQQSQDSRPFGSKAFALFH